MVRNSDTHTCAVCGKRFTARNLVPGAIVRDVIAAAIAHDHPEWSAGSFICHADLTRYRTSYVHSLLEVRAR